MKLNSWQKIVLFVYGCVFVYFGIIHVPFKSSYGGGIKYDTIFSNRSNLDISRLVIIVLALTILTVVLILLLRNLSYPVGKLPKRAIRIVVFSFVVVILLIFAVWGLAGLGNKDRDNSGEIRNTTVESSSSITDSTSSVGIAPLSQKKSEICNEAQALIDFKSYMKFYYPDWKIFGKPEVLQQSDCVFRVQFTTLDPHIGYHREVIIVEIAYINNYEEYNFRTVRGTLY